jgi:hypothetical protein
MAQEPIVKIGTVLDMGGHKMPVKSIVADGVIVTHQGSDIEVSQAAVEHAVEESSNGV